MLQGLAYGVRPEPAGPKLFESEVGVVTAEERRRLVLAIFRKKDVIEEFREGTVMFFRGYAGVIVFENSVQVGETFSQIRLYGFKKGECGGRYKKYGTFDELKKILLHVRERIEEESE